ncbi:tetratricopeptide repeat protein [Candidatus Pacearchaeota archaeon]|nr:tetratricopeptide repeat protein [Candidatus Pacearchaeota archaeon]
MDLQKKLDEAGKLLYGPDSSKRKENLENALDIYTEVSKVDDRASNRDAQLGIQLSLGFLGRLDESDNILKILIQDDLEDSLPYHNRGDINRELGNLEEAVKDYTKGIEVDPEAFPVYNNRGLALLELGNFSEAILDFTRSIQLFPHEVFYNNRGSAYLLLEEYDKAIEDFNEAIDFNEDNVSITSLSFRGDCYRLKGDDFSAIIDYKSVLELFGGKENKILVDYIAAIRAERGLAKLDVFCDEPIEPKAILDEIATSERLDRFFKHYK